MRDYVFVWKLPSEEEKKINSLKILAIFKCRNEIPNVKWPIEKCNRYTATFSTERGKKAKKKKI